jgi:hypothetical protein
MKNTNLHIYYFFLFLSALLLIFSCRKEEEDFIKDPSARLSIYTDTVMFDTVFTSMGTASKRFKVYNYNNKSLKISQIILGRGFGSPFRINVDGEAGVLFENYTLLPGDSFYVFVNVNIDPNDQSSAFIEKDSIIFICNHTIQDVKLIAWGQNAIYLKDTMLDCNSRFYSDSSYVIFNYIGIKKDCKLTVESGAKIYCDYQSGIIVWGSLEVNGTYEEPVNFAGVRKEVWYKNEPGQWHGIWFLPGSKNNVIKNASIRNATVGIRVDSLPVNSNPNLILHNVVIENMSEAGILGYTAHITAYNTLVNNCCNYLVAADLGGTYNFYHCTFDAANCKCYPEKACLAFYNTNYINPDQGLNIPNDLNLNIRNSIIWGSKKEETEFIKSGDGAFHILIDHTLIKTEKTTLDINNNILNQNPKFTAPCKYQYEPDSLSPVIDKGIILHISELDKDLKNNIRFDGKPDLGAIEKNN